MAHHNDVGKWGEDLACQMLIEQGATIRERNFCVAHVEIDIIATKGDELIFAEVKTRSNPAEDPLECIDRRKIQRMVRAADSYLKTCPVPLYPRFDLFAIRGTQFSHTIEHIPDAFHAPLKTYR